MKKYRKHKKFNGFRIKLLLFVFLIFTIVLVPKVYSANFNNLKFIQVSDVHYSSFEDNTSYKMLENSIELFDDAIDQINSVSNVNFVMFTGDMINLPLKKELLGFIKEANKICHKWYVVLGNHDVDVDGKLTKKMYFDILNSHNLNFAQTNSYYSFIPKKGYKVIGLDTTIDGEFTAQGLITQEQLQWLDKELKSAGNSVVILFMHAPLEPPYHSPSHIVRNAEEVKAVINKYNNPMLICSGHYHAVRVKQDENKLYISSPALVSYPNAFRIVNIHSQKQKIIVDLYLKETRLDEVRTRAKIRILGSSVIYGEDSDRTGTYELKR